MFTRFPLPTFNSPISCVWPASFYTKLQTVQVWPNLCFVKLSNFSILPSVWSQECHMLPITPSPFVLPLSGKYGLEHQRPSVLRHSTALSGGILLQQMWLKLCPLNFHPEQKVLSTLSMFPTIVYISIGFPLSLWQSGEHNPNLSNLTSKIH